MEGGNRLWRLVTLWNVPFKSTCLLRWQTQMNLQAVSPLFPFFLALIFSLSFFKNNFLSRCSSQNSIETSFVDASFVWLCVSVSWHNQSWDLTMWCPVVILKHSTRLTNAGESGGLKKGFVEKGNATHPSSVRKLDKIPKWQKHNMMSEKKQQVETF